MIVAKIRSWSEVKPGARALVVNDREFSWQELCAEIDSRDGEPIGESVKPVIDQALNRLAWLATEKPIIGTTSGSTGEAKRYSRSQLSWLRSFEAESKEFGIDCNDVIVAPGSLEHSLFFYALCAGLARGATVILSDRFSPKGVLKQINHYQATVLYAVPTQLKLLLAAAPDVSDATDPTEIAKPEAPCPSLRWILSSGARWFSELTSDLSRLFPRAQIGEFYGASETSFISVAKHGLDSNLPPGSVGLPFYGVQVSAGKEGEPAPIWVHSEALFEGYIGSTPAEFKERVDSVGRRWISIGDIGWANEAGYLFLTGREARKIITSGKNLYPEEVEEALCAHPSIHRAAVLGIRDDTRGEKLVALISSGDAPPSRSQIIDHLKPLLDDYKIPRLYLFVDDWPVTAAGKTDFSALEKFAQKELSENQG